jgi:predicted permease
VTVDTILWLFCIIVGGIILVIVMVGGLIVIAREFEHDPWALAKRTFLGNFIMVLVWGATKGFLFISPTDGWVEIIVESLAVSLISTVVMVMGAEVYFRWRRETERTKGEKM